MWTDFNNACYKAMWEAATRMNDYREISFKKDKKLTPSDTISLHNDFKDSLEYWFEKLISDQSPKVVISHHAPCWNPNSRFVSSPLKAVYNSVDMEDVIIKYSPNLWIYGHTHEYDDHFIEKTRVISNPFGYPEQEITGDFKIIEIA